MIILIITINITITILISITIIAINIMMMIVAIHIMMMIVARCPSPVAGERPQAARFGEAGGWDGRKGGMTIISYYLI